MTICTTPVPKGQKGLSGQMMGSWWAFGRGPFSKDVLGIVKHFTAVTETLVHFAAKPQLSPEVLQIPLSSFLSHKCRAPISGTFYI